MSIFKRQISRDSLSWAAALVAGDIQSSRSIRSAMADLKSATSASALRLSAGGKYRVTFKVRKHGRYKIRVSAKGVKAITLILKTQLQLV